VVVLVRAMNDGAAGSDAARGVRAGGMYEEEGAADDDCCYDPRLWWTASEEVHADDETAPLVDY
jgi:hypothetical protein